MARLFTLAVGPETLGVGLKVQREAGKRKSVPAGRWNVVLLAQDVGPKLQDVGRRLHGVGTKLQWVGRLAGLVDWWAR